MGGRLRRSSRQCETKRNSKCRQESPKRRPTKRTKVIWTRSQLIRKPKRTKRRQRRRNPRIRIILAMVDMVLKADLLIQRFSNRRSERKSLTNGITKEGSTQRRDTSASEPLRFGSISAGLFI